VSIIWRRRPRERQEKRRESSSGWSEVGVMDVVGDVVELELELELVVVVVVVVRYLPNNPLIVPASIHEKNGNMPDSKNPKISSA
jgi:predicted metalloprotease